MLEKEESVTDQTKDNFKFQPLNNGVNLVLFEKAERVRGSSRGAGHEGQAREHVLLLQDCR